MKKRPKVFQSITYISCLLHLKGSFDISLFMRVDKTSSRKISTSKTKTWLLLSLLELAEFENIQLEGVKIKSLLILHDIPSYTTPRRTGYNV